MDFSIHIDTLGMGLSIVYIKGSQVEFSNVCVFRSLKVVIILANRVDPDEIQHYAAFHLGLHCLPKKTLRGCQYRKD